MHEDKELIYKKITQEDSDKLFRLNYETNGLLIFLTQTLRCYDEELCNDDEILSIFDDLIHKIIERNVAENYIILHYIKTIGELISYQNFDRNTNQLVFNNFKEKDIDIAKIDSAALLPIIACKKLNISDFKKLTNEKNKKITDIIIKRIIDSKRIFYDVINKMNKNSRKYFFYDIINNNLIFYNKDTNE